ncbi:peptide chain release factor N(5)-glutamine methyltransferase [uncultured Jatrophihabitans sp.]|uniref:peptide chain release factor N(5)-glutamine methyltransferase n=1 Tax=uncultured Jatrophihabitans sp. TaxID=1610747 RepID=UPI0035CAE4AA
MSVAVRALLADATQRLRSAGVDSPRVDAELLLAFVLEVPRGRLVALDDVPASVAATFDEHVTRRATREPLQHITGVTPFRHLLLAVGPGVFVPRPETELLVDAVLPHLRSLEAPLVVDLCAGSGALGLAIAAEVPGASVIAVEASEQAARWLLRNAEGTSAQVIVGDVRDPELLRELHGRVDAVVCNPPYVPRHVHVAPEVRADPREAVFAGGDGLDLMSTVVALATVLLRAGGRFALEHDDTHAVSVPALLSQDERWTDVVDHDDLTGRPRYVTSRRV